MALHQLVSIEGKRHEITGKVIIHEHTCDSCGEFVTEYAEVRVPPSFGNGSPGTVIVEICGACVPARFPGLLDLAVKVAGRA